MGIEVSAVHTLTRKEEGEKTLKERVFRELLRKLEETVRNMERLLRADFDGDGDEVDAANYLATTRTGAVLSLRISKLKEEINSLSCLDLSERETVSPGALIVAEVDGKKERYLVLPAESFSRFERLEVDGEEYFTLTTRAPLYEALRGKREGDEVFVNGTKVVILEVS